MPPKGRPVTKDFFELLKQCVDSDQDVRFIGGDKEDCHRRYAELLDVVAEKVGKVERFRATGRVDTPEEAALREANYDKSLEKRFEVFDQGRELLSKLVEQRKRKFNKLYRVAQKHIDRPAYIFNDGDRLIPLEFFSQMRDLLDCRRANDIHKVSVAKLRQRLIDVNRELVSLHAKTRVAGAVDELLAQRRELSKERTRAEFDRGIRESNVAERERDLVNCIWEYVASNAGMFGRITSNTSQVSRGDKHNPMDKELPPEAATVPSSRDDLVRAKNTAAELHKAKLARHDRLGWRYHIDLERYLQAAPSNSRLEYDRQFFKDRAQAMREVEIAESHVKYFTNRLKKERRQQLRDRTSDFGDITDDGRVSSMGTNVMRELRRHRELGEPYIEEYLENIDESNLASPSKPISDRRHSDDSSWQARPIALGDFDTVSRAGDPRTGKKIREWRDKMERMREKLRGEDSSS